MEHNFVLNNLKFIQKILNNPNQYTLSNGTVEVAIEHKNAVRNDGDGSRDEERTPESKINDGTVVSKDKESKKYTTTKITDLYIHKDKYYIKDLGSGDGYFLYKGKLCVDNIEKDEIIIQQRNPDSSATQNGTFYYLDKSDTTGGRKKNKTRKSKKHKKSKKYKKSKSRRSRKYKK